MNKKKSSNSDGTISKVVKGYRFEKYLGKGAYSKVYRCIKQQTQQIVAIKVFQNIRQNDVQSIQNQVNIIKSLNHPNIIKCFQYFKENNTWFAVFEYCGIGDLNTYVQELRERHIKIPEPIAKTTIAKILSALAYMHQHKIVHRDLKLANILINDAWDVKIADFGLSKKFQQSSVLKTRCGTPLLMAPQILFGQQYNEKCDTWSLGVIGYFLLCGDYPFMAQSVPQLRQTIFKTKIPHYSQQLKLSDEAKKFINKCLQIQHEKRPKLTVQLLQNPWFKGSLLQSNVRINFMKNSIRQDSQICQNIDESIQASLSHEILSFTKNMQAKPKQIRDILQQINRLYSSNIELRLLFILLEKKKLQELKNYIIQFKIGERLIEIKGQKIKIFKESIKQLQDYLEQKYTTILEMFETPLQNKDQNYQRQITSFITSTCSKYLENAENNFEKIKCLQNLIKIVNLKIQKCLIQINHKKIGDKQYEKQFLTYIENFLSKQKIIQLANSFQENSQDSYKDVKEKFKDQLDINCEKVPIEIQGSRVFMVAQIIQRTLKLIEQRFVKKQVFDDIQDERF